MSFIQSLDENILVTLLGMGVVFAVLIILSVVILLFKYIKKDSQPEKPYTEKQPIHEKGEDLIDKKLSVKDEVKDKGEELNDELIAVISAAIAAYTAEDFKLKIRSIRKIGQIESTWAMAGRNDIINSRI